MLEMLDKIKDASNGPEHAKRRIEALDKMVFNLKTRRRICGESMESDANKMRWIDKELGIIMKQYQPLCTRLKERVTTKERLEMELDLAEKTMLKLMSETKHAAVEGMLANSRMQKRNASMTLKAARGFGIDPSTTFKQKHRSRPAIQNSVTKNFKK